jgi:hypothetical protein
VVKLIEGEWKWQERFTLGKQLEKIVADLVTKQVQRYARNHGITVDESAEAELNMDRTDSTDGFARRKLELVELRDPELLPDCIDDDGQEELDETYDVVYGLVADDEELTLFVSAIEHCGNFKDLPEHTGWKMKKVYRLMEKLMRRIRRSKLAEVRGKTEDSDEGKKRMRFIDKIYRFEAESKSAEENYRAFGTTREEHQKKMLEFIRKKLEAKKRLYGFTDLV